MTTAPSGRSVTIKSDGTVIGLYPSNVLHPSGGLYPGVIGAPSDRSVTILREDRTTIIDHEDRKVIMA